jgi:hypothetical protein
VVRLQPFNAIRPSRETRTLLRLVSSATPESEQPSLSRAFREHGAPKLLRAVKALIDLLIDLLFSIVSDAVETVIVAQFKPVKSLLEMGDNDLVAPLSSSIVTIAVPVAVPVAVAVFSAPLLVSCSVNFPARCVNDAPLHKERNLVVFYAPVYTQRGGCTRVQGFVGF